MTERDKLIYEMLEQHLGLKEITARLGVSKSEAYRLALHVLDEYGDPGRVQIEKHLAEIERHIAKI